MNLWFVIYIGTAVGGSIGPLPYDMAECQLRALDNQQRLSAQISTGHDVNGNPIDPFARLMRFKCEQHVERPAITFQTGAQL